MNLKNKKILIILIGLLIIIILILLISRIIFKSNSTKNIPNTSNEEIEESSKKATQNALEEKAKFAQEHKGQKGVVSTSIDYGDYNITSYSSNDYSSIDKKKEKAEQKSENVKNIIRKYYAEDYDRITNDIKENTNTNEVINILTSDLTDSDKEYYDLVLKVVENNNLTSEELNTLKDYISGQMYNIKKDENLKIRAENILNN